MAPCATPRPWPNRTTDGDTASRHPSRYQRQRFQHWVRSEQKFDLRYGGPQRRLVPATLARPAWAYFKHASFDKAVVGIAVYATNCYGGKYPSDAVSLIEALDDDRELMSSRGQRAQLDADDA